MLRALALWAVMPVLAAALVLTLYRIVRGPSAPDRVVALDLLTVVVIGMIAAYEVATDQPVYLDVAITLALVSFLGTIAFARYVERGR
ncbi:MAG: cation:proton antiporter [Armatimonadota bacterium]|nr:cation:proton antiporter [Armatimonadota bacterium]MDR7421905.1 cation:proton antiporter [Armatimonadota bacterium]MDR7454464.1 cation:proton antiporter [Armatimonadota bacterium]MDR7457797.1 cation:proton antiporter [Armatimonadota bacterium]MDR7497297.1 cation:proton antiporter [Armatimonadota bacterium]